MVPVAEYSAIEQFFGGPWNKWVHKLRYLIILIMAGWIGFAVYKAKDIGPLTEEEDFLPEDHPISVVGTLLREKFSSSGTSVLRVYVFWGVKDIITDDVGLWDASDLGKVVMDDQFSLSSREAQQNILDFCEDLKTQEFVLDQGVKCWLKDTFEVWLAQMR